MTATARTLLIDAQDLAPLDRIAFTDTPSGVGAPRRLRRGTITRITPGRIAVACDDGTRAHIHPARTKERNLRIEVPTITAEPIDTGEAVRLLNGHPAARAAGRLLRAIEQAHTGGDFWSIGELTRTLYQELAATFSTPNRMARQGVVQMVQGHLFHKHGAQMMFAQMDATRDITHQFAPPSEPSDVWQITSAAGKVLGRVTCEAEDLVPAAVEEQFGKKVVRAGYGRRRLTVDELG